MRENEKKQINKEEYLYHNTEVLLKNYRDVIWRVEVSLNSVKSKFENQFECDLETFLELSYAAGADLSGTDIEDRMRTLERNRKMLKIIQDSLEFLRTKHKKGKLYYQILYVSFISPEEKECVEDIVEELAEAGYIMSTKTFFRKKHEAIECLSNILWGYSSKSCIDVVNKFLD